MKKSQARPGTTVCGLVYGMAEAYGLVSTAPDAWKVPEGQRPPPSKSSGAKMRMGPRYWPAGAQDAWILASGSQPAEAGAGGGSSAFVSPLKPPAPSLRQTQPPSPVSPGTGKKVSFCPAPEYSSPPSFSLGSRGSSGDGESPLKGAGRWGVL